VTKYVATRKLWAECPTRGGFEVDLQIGAPYQISDVEWACSVGLDALYKDLGDQHGVDSWQVLMLAQRLAKTLLEGFVQDGGRLFDAERRNQAILVANLFESGT
jgi:hypothetical protein